MHLPCPDNSEILWHVGWMVSEIKYLTLMTIDESGDKIAPGINPKDALALSWQF